MTNSEEINLEEKIKLIEEGKRLFIVRDFTVFNAAVIGVVACICPDFVREHYLFTGIYGSIIGLLGLVAFQIPLPKEYLQYLDDKEKKDYYTIKYNDLKKDPTSLLNNLYK